MKKTLSTSAIAIAIAFFTPILFAQDFDFKTLDKLGANAKSSTNVTLDGDLLKMAAAFLGSGGDRDGAAIKALVGNLKGIYVRAYEFDKPGQYSESDVAPLRAFLKPPKWHAIVDVRENQEWTQVYFLPAANNKLGGVAVVSTEPTSLTVVYINGEIDPGDLEKLSGNMGIPEIKGLPKSKSSDKAMDKKSAK